MPSKKTLKTGYIQDSELWNSAIYQDLDYSIFIAVGLQRPSSPAGRETAAK